MALVGQQWLFIGYFEGLSSERGIAWRVSDSLSLRSFLDLDVTEAALWTTRRCRHARRMADRLSETHVAVFTSGVESGSPTRAVPGCSFGKTVGLDATDVGSERGDAEHLSGGTRANPTRRSPAGGQRGHASGVETPTRADLARFDRSAEEQEDVEQPRPQSLAGPGSRRSFEDEGRSDAPGPQGRARGRPADTASHRLGSSGARMRRICDSRGFAAGDADDGVRAGRGLCSRDGPAGVEEVVADKGYHSDKTLTWRSTRPGTLAVTYHGTGAGSALLAGQESTGETPPEKRAAKQRALLWEPPSYSRSAGPSFTTGGVASWWSGAGRGTSMKPGGPERRVWVRRAHGAGCPTRRVLIQASRLQHRAAADVA